jgi:solute carrier family 35 protein E1
MAARAPFTHTSSTVDLTSAETLSSSRTFNQHFTVSSYTPASIRSRTDEDLLSTPTPFYRSAHTGPSRSPSPHPFAIPTIRSPALETVRFVSLCVLWYASSAVSSNSGKVILNNFRFPVTLTIIQFFFVAGCCYVFSRPILGWSTQLRSPTRSILRGTLPMAAFQVGGHIFSSLAISRVPVSTVHTIKVRLRSNSLR